MNWNQTWPILDKNLDIMSPDPTPTAHPVLLYY